MAESSCTIPTSVKSNFVLRISQDARGINFILHKSTHSLSSGALAKENGMVAVRVSTMPRLMTTRSRPEMVFELDLDTDRGQIRLDAYR